MRLSSPRWIERLLFVIGIVCLGAWAYVYLDARFYEMWQNQRLEEAIEAKAASSDLMAQPQRTEERKGTGGERASETDSLDSFSQDEDDFSGLTADGNLDDGELIGRIKIPRVGVSALVLEGVRSRTLRRGVGRIPGTSLPDLDGNVGLAGHRDSFFRGLKDIRKNDIIELKTPEGIFEYKVEWTKIVRPKDTHVLEDEGTPALTLVTCYPFYYVGSAPKRFIVRAHRVGEPEGGAETGVASTAGRTAAAGDRQTGAR